jgi:hypothetical protein
MSMNGDATGVGHDTDGDGLNDTVQIYGSTVSGVDSTAWINVSITDASGTLVMRAPYGRVDVVIVYDYYAFYDASIILPVFNVTSAYWVHADMTDSGQNFCQGVNGNSVELSPLGEYSPQLMVGEDARSTFAGTDVVYDVMVANYGTNQDTINVTASSSLGWTIELSQASFVLNPGQPAYLAVSVHVPSASVVTAMDTTTLNAVSMRRATDVDSLTLQTTVIAHIYGAELTEFLGSGMGQLGGTLYYNLTLTNSGNGPDTFNISWPSPPPGWSINVSPTSPTLTLLAATTISVVIGLPPVFDSNFLWNVYITANASDGTTLAERGIQAYIEVPDLALGAADVVVLNATAKLGDVLAIDVTVHNLGNPLDLNVTVTITGGAQNNSTVASMHGPLPVTVRLPWTVTSAAFTFTVTVDQHNDFPETDEGNNDVSRSFTVNFAPTARITANATAHAGQAVTISGANSTDPDGDAMTYYFDFGDGQSTGWTANSTVEHLYAAPGLYNVSIRAKDSTGQESSAATLQVNITAPEDEGGTAAPPPSFIPGFGGLLAIAGVAAVAGAFRARRDRKL